MRPVRIGERGSWKENDICGTGQMTHHGRAGGLVG